MFLRNFFLFAFPLLAIAFTHVVPTDARLSRRSSMTGKLEPREERLSRRNTLQKAAGHQNKAYFHTQAAAHFDGAFDGKKHDPHQYHTTQAQKARAAGHHDLADLHDKHAVALKGASAEQAHNYHVGQAMSHQGAANALIDHHNEHHAQQAQWHKESAQHLHNNPHVKPSEMHHEAGVQAGLKGDHDRASFHFAQSHMTKGLPNSVGKEYHSRAAQDHKKEIKDS